MADAAGAEVEASAAALEYGRWLFAQPCEFVTGAVQVDHLPVTDLPEIAFAGRSNVGKSSLINAITGRKTLARTSNTPGRTREVNFFLLGGRLMLVDLPGYGYAKAAKHQVQRWNELITDYLRGRQNLRRVCLLIDGRRGLMAADEKVMALMDEAAVNYQAVLTKADKVKEADRERLWPRIGADLAKHPAAHPELLTTSASGGAGIPELKAVLAALVEDT